MAALIVLIVFIGVPIAEIVVMIEVGSVIGTVPTIALIILTAVTGTVLIRYQGLGVLAEVRRGVDAGEPPINPLIDGLFLLVAGALLLTPGFLTDAIGLVCLVPPLRRLIANLVWQRLVRSGHARVVTSGGSPARGSDIEGEFVDLTPDNTQLPGAGRPDPDSRPGLPTDTPPDSPWSPDDQR